MNDQQQSRADAPLSLIPHLVARDERAVSTALLEMCDALTKWCEEAQKYREITSHDQNAFSDGYEAGMAAMLSAHATSANETGAEGATGIAHELWAAAQLAPGEGIEDGVRRIEAIISRSPAMAAAVPADERATWSNARDSLAVAMAGFAGRSGNRDFNAAIGVLDAITEPGLPLAWLRTARAAASPAADWRELARRLYVELFHCDQQMRSTRDEDGEPHWTQSAVVRDVLADAKAALDGAPQPAQADAPAETRPTSFHFHRFVDGQKMAEDVLIERERTLDAAIRAAVRSCPKRLLTVLVHAPALRGAPADAGEARLTDDLRTEFEWCLAEGNIGPRTRAAIQRLLNGADHDQ